MQYKSNLKKMCISVYGVESLQKMYDVIKLCDKLEILKRLIEVILCVNIRNRDVLRNLYW